MPFFDIKNEKQIWRVKAGNQLDLNYNDERCDFTLDKVYDDETKTFEMF